MQGPDDPPRRAHRRRRDPLPGRRDRRGGVRRRRRGRDEGRAAAHARRRQPGARAARRARGRAALALDDREPVARRARARHADLDVVRPGEPCAVREVLARAGARQTCARDSESPRRARPSAPGEARARGSDRHSRRPRSARRRPAGSGSDGSRRRRPGRPRSRRAPAADGAAEDVVGAGAEIVVGLVEVAAWDDFDSAPTAARDVEPTPARVGVAPVRARVAAGLGSRSIAVDSRIFVTCSGRSVGRRLEQDSGGGASPAVRRTTSPAPLGTRQGRSSSSPDREQLGKRAVSGRGRIERISRPGAARSL